MRKPQRSLVEQLEHRQLLAADLTVDFAPPGAALAGGTVGDFGYVYGPRDGANTYGWSKDVSADAVERITTYTPYQRGKTFITMNDSVWEIALASGKYALKVGVGDTDKWGDPIKITAENQTVVNTTTTSSKRLTSASATVEVTDGKLTLAGASGAYVNTLGYIEITYVGPASTPTPDPTPDPTPNPNPNPTPTGTLPVTIDFAPIGAALAGGTVGDTGAVYGPRTGGYTFGWSDDVSADAVERVSTYTPYQRGKTFITMNDNVWEIALPSGRYSIKVGVGDPDKWGDAIKITAEGKTVVNTITTSSKRLTSGSLTLDVTDGKLTLAGASGAYVNTLAYVEIAYVGPASTPNPTPDPTPDPTPNPNPTPTPTGTLKWTAAAKMPTPRVEPESMVVNGKLYVFSGYADTSWQPIKRSDYYDPNTNTWTRIADMPVATTHSAVALVGSKIWFVGGYTARPGTTDRQDFGTTTVLIYDTTTDTWSTGPSLPARRASGGLALVNNTLHFFAGEDEKRLNRTDHWSLDLNNLAAGWSTRKAIPEARTHFGTAVVDGIVYAIGGQLGIDKASVHLKTAWSYNPATDSWKRLADLPQKRSHLSPCTVAVGTKIYTFGGEYEFNVDVATVTEYDTITNTYRNLTSLPGARASGAAGYIDGKFIFTGGKKNNFNADTWIGTFV